MNIHPQRHIIGLLLILVSVGLLAACQPAAPAVQTTYSVVSAGELDSGEAIPVPENETILTVTGDISRANVDDTIQMDMATLESVGVVEYDVLDPFANSTITYRGVLMSELLDVWGVSADATTLTLTAINDYAIDVPISAVREYPVMMALQADGEYMAIADKGPSMLVFPYDDFELDKALYNDMWIWQIASVEVS